MHNIFSSHNLLVCLSLYYPKGKTSEINLKKVLVTSITKYVKRLKIFILLYIIKVGDGPLTKKINIKKLIEAITLWLYG